jgi:hypothetical protein
MRLENCRQSYYYNSGKASDICRKLGFAGIALIWAFRVTRGKETIIPDNLRWAGVLLIAGLALDFLHYIVGTIVWGAYNRFKETQNTPETQEFLAPRWINYPSNTCFVLKQVAIFLACILLIASMFGSFWK